MLNDVTNGKIPNVHRRNFNVKSTLSNIQIRSDNIYCQPSTGLAARSGFAANTDNCKYFTRMEHYQCRKTYDLPPICWFSVDRGVCATMVIWRGHEYMRLYTKLTHAWMQVFFRVFCFVVVRSCSVGKLRQICLVERECTSSFYQYLHAIELIASGPQQSKSE